MSPRHGPSEEAAGPSRTASAPRRDARGGQSMLPPTLDGRTLKRVPRRYREDAFQDAWAAYLAGADPNVAVWSLVKRLRRAQRRCVCFSQLDPDQQRVIYEELPG